MPTSAVHPGRLLPLLLPLLAAAAPAWSQTAPAAPAPLVQQAAPVLPEAEPTGRERELIERIRQLKTPRWRPFGACRYDWGAWRLNEKGVRSTASECGDPPIRGTVAVFCDSLQINRRVGEGAWEGWRLPFTAAEAPLLGEEDRLVASLCANVKPTAAAGAKGAPRTPPVMGAPAQPSGAAQPAKPAQPAVAKPAAR